jgi:hypothetical protein
MFKILLKTTVVDKRGVKRNLSSSGEEQVPERQQQAAHHRTRTLNEAAYPAVSPERHSHSPSHTATAPNTKQLPADLNSGRQKKPHNFTTTITCTSRDP